MDHGWKIIIALAIVFGIIISWIVLNNEAYKEITPNDEFFVVSIGESPDIALDDWTLKVEGLVETPLNFTYENITSFPITSEVVTLKCVDGPQGTANWTGVRLKAILDLVGISEGAREVVVFGEDGYSSSLTIQEATSPDVILAYEMNGETLPVDHGYPVRLVVPGKYGYKWVKWITHIQVVDYDYKGYWESRGWSDDADVTIISDWWIHSVLLTVSAFFGSLSLLSGFRFSKHVKFGRKLPDMFSRKFHIRTSQIYNILLISVALLWMINAYDKRGNFPNTSHGVLALIVVILAVSGAVLGYVIKFKPGIKYLRTLHLSFNLLGYLLLLGAILTGILIAGIL
ncbi:MAG: molybdopterin-dependent oxidoreductase [Methanomassiliicoccales archaeon]|nr:MAG: molybdopterin-dependent oxidoreductase [Methanomassiliicoccales archaeon]